MNELSQQPESGKKFQMESFISSSLIEITRIFDAPVENVWRAWSEPKLAKMWWGPQGYSCPEARIDFREGGEAVLAMKNNKTGEVVWSKSIYQEIIPYELIRCTDQFCNEKGEVISPSEVGMPGEWPVTCLITVKIHAVDDDDRTQMTLLHEGIPLEMQDDCISGWSSSFEKLESLVERI